MTAADPVVLERSIALSVEELGVLGVLLGVRLGLPAQWVPQVTSADGAARATAAAQALADRGVLAHVDGTPVVAHPVARLVEVVGRAALRAQVLVRDLPGGVMRRHQVRAVPAAAVELRETDDGLLCTPFATSDLVIRLAALAGLDVESTAVGSGVELPYGALVRARRAALAGDRVAATDALVSTGAAADAVAPLVDALVGPHRVVAAHVEHATGPARREGGELAWLQSGGHLWRMPTVGVPDGRPDDRRRAPIGAVTVTVDPVDPTTLLRALHDAVPTAPEPE